MNEDLDDPTDPVLCVPEQDHEEYWSILTCAYECRFGGPGSTVGVKMHSTAAFLSMPNDEGVILGGKTNGGFNENSMRGYLLRLALTTRQVIDVVMYAEEILRVKGGRQVADDVDEILDEEVKREETRKICALRYLDGYPDTKVIDPIKENYPACTMPLSSTSPVCVLLQRSCAMRSTRKST